MVCEPKVTDAQIRDNLALVHFHVKSIRRRLPPSVLYEDLVAAGKLGLLQALMSDPGANVAYLSIRIRGAILDALRAADWSPRRRSTDRPEDAVHVVTMAPSDLPHVAAPDTLERRSEARDFVRLTEVLSKRERKVIRWILDGLLIKEIASKLGVSSTRVLQVRDRAVERMKEQYRAPRRRRKRRSAP